MLKIRLRRMGARNSPHYRIVVSDSRRTARAEVLEELGSYDPKREPTVISFDQERARTGRMVRTFRPGCFPSRRNPAAATAAELHPFSPLIAA